MPKSIPTPKRTAALPWWLSEGEEECPHCGLLYLYELEVRCVDCDSPCCPMCIEIHATSCPTCVPERAPHG